MLEFYGDVIVMRHFQQGAPHEAAKWASIPIINGGDGWGEHPTQILTDLYTVLVEKGRIDGLNWLAVGDMRMRTMHSLGYALTQFDCPITFVARPTCRSRPSSRQSSSNIVSLFRGRARRTGHRQSRRDPGRAGRTADYTKSRDERGKEVSLTPANYRITRELLEKKPSRMRFCCTRCRAWTKSQPMWTSPAGRASGKRRSMAS